MPCKSEGGRSSKNQGSVQQVSYSEAVEMTEGASGNEDEMFFFSPIPGVFFCVKVT